MPELQIRYHWWHFETDKTGECIGIFINELDCLQKINLWNSDDRWKYWVSPVDLAEPHNSLKNKDAQ